MRGEDLSASWLNETNRDEVTADIVPFPDRTLTPQSTCRAGSG